MALKIDMEKAYDHLLWDFINGTLEDARFSTQVVSLIMSCVSSSSMKILWNGGVTDAFIPWRGVRQGDPMSPYLFVLTMERLKHAVSRVVSNGSWSLIMLGRGGPPLSHLFLVRRMP